MESETIKRKAIGEKIRQARALIGISQEDLGKVLNVNGSAISKIESGIRSISVLELNIIAQATNQTVQFFLEEEKPEIKPNDKYIDISDIREEDLDMVYTMLECLRNRYKVDKREKTG